MLVLLSLVALPAAGVIIVTDPDLPSRHVAQDTATPGFDRADVQASTIASGSPLTVAVMHGRSRATVLYVNEDKGLSISFELERAATSPPPLNGSSAGVDGSILFRVSQPMHYELSGEIEVQDSGAGDLVFLEVTLWNLLRGVGHGPNELLFDAQKRSETTPNEALSLGLVGGDLIDEEEGSLTGTLLPVLPGDPLPDRVYRLDYDSFVIDRRDDSGDSGAIAFGSVVLRLTPAMPAMDPSISTTKRDVLAADDGDGRLEPGEMVEYLIVVENAGTADALEVLFEDVPDLHSDLLIGSVDTSRGTVVSGNTAGDTDVAVDLGTLPIGERADLSFRVILDDPFPEDVQQLSNRGRVTGANFAVVTTDDPDTAISGDETSSFVANTPLDRCEREQESLATDLLMCEEDLAEGLSDSDADGVLDLVDACSATPAGAETDGLGCAQSEFCANVNHATSWLRAAACMWADWKNDEPLFARDCRWGRGVCAARRSRPERSR